MADRTRPALAQETACSVLRPPNTTAIRIFRGPTPDPHATWPDATWPTTDAPAPDADPGVTFPNATSSNEPSRSRPAEQQAPRVRPAQRLQGHIRVRHQ